MFWKIRGDPRGGRDLAQILRLTPVSASREPVPDYIASIIHP